MTVFQLLDIIRRRPAMYVGYNTPSHLAAFINGYRQAIDEELVLQDTDYSGFYDWVAQKLGYSDSVAGWARMIGEQREDQEEALWLFFQLLDEYRGFNPRILATVAYSNQARPNPSRYNFYGLRGSSAEITHKEQPTTLTIEEVWPTREWVALYAKKTNIILDRCSADTFDQAQERAFEIYGVDKNAWQTNT